MLNRRKLNRYPLINTGAGRTMLVDGNVAKKISRFEQMIIAILDTDLKGLRVEHADIEQYAKELSQYNILRFSFLTKKLICVNPVNPYKWLPKSLRRKYYQKRAEIVGCFLLSTNFFFNNMDEQQEIKYSGFMYQTDKYDYSNPFSGGHYQTEASN